MKAAGKRGVSGDRKGQASSFWRGKGVHCCGVAEMDEPWRCHLSAVSSP
jgi:hypothetical protein